MADEQTSGEQAPDTTIGGFKDKGRRVAKWIFSTVATTLIGGPVMLYFFNATLQPTFATSSVEIVARRESPRLSVLWDREPIENLCIATVGLWNDGKQPLTHANLTESSPVRIVVLGNATILEAAETNASRSTLTLTPTILQNRREVSVSIAGGDALEQGDGAAIRLLFTGDCTNARLQVVGRVIGAPTGFQPPGYMRGWVKNGLFFALLIAVPVLCITGFFAFFYRFVEHKRYILGIGGAILLLMPEIFFLLTVDKLAATWPSRPPWLPVSLSDTPR